MANLESIASSLFGAGGKSRAGNLQYPMDVGHMSRSDHYVQFFINEQIDAKANISGGAVPDQNINVIAAGTPFERREVVYADRRERTVPRAPTTRASGSITLYMPNQIQVSQKANYGEAEIGLLVAGAIASFNTVSGGLGNIDLGSVADTLKKESGKNTLRRLRGAGLCGRAFGGGDEALCHFRNFG
mgnify:CR=1 FL=1